MTCIKKQDVTYYVMYAIEMLSQIRAASILLIQCQAVKDLYNGFLLFHRIITH